MNYFKLIAILLIGVQLLSQSEAESKANCANGVFNAKTSECICYPNYSGDKCAKLSCPASDPIGCSSVSKMHCKVDIMGSYCPKFCGLC